MELLADAVLIALFVWATAAVIRKKAAKEPDPSRHAFYGEGDEHPMSDYSQSGVGGAAGALGALGPRFESCRPD